MVTRRIAFVRRESSSFLTRRKTHFRILSSIPSPPYVPSGRNVTKLFEPIYKDCSLLRVRSFSNSNGCDESKSETIVNNETFTTHNDDQHDDYTRLLTMATARQLKGDVGEAIALANKALANLRLLSPLSSRIVRDDIHSVDEEIADTLLFLGKLHQLHGSLEEAISLFEESREIYKQQQHNNGESENTPENTPKFALQTRRKELVALSHLATAKGRLQHEENEYNDNDAATIEADFQEALEGLEEVAGWEDGMTNHTAHEWSLYCSRTKNDPEKALNILSRMKQNLTNAFGSDDRRVLQLNGILAELWQKIGEKDMGDKAKSCIVETSTEENAISLLEEALDTLPPNSPEALRVFMQLEELKERQER